MTIIKRYHTKFLKNYPKLDKQIYLYVLRCENDKYYIGRTKDLNTRINNHMLGLGCYWTKLHKPLYVVDKYRTTNVFAENDLTLRYMKDYGAENVRGGLFVGKYLSYKEKKMINMILDGKYSKISHEMKNKLLWSGYDKCHRCGRSTHFVRDCNELIDVNCDIIV